MGNRLYAIEMEEHKPGDFILGGVSFVSNLRNKEGKVIAYSKISEARKHAEGHKTMSNGPEIYRVTLYTGNNYVLWQDIVEGVASL